MSAVAEAAAIKAAIRDEALALGFDAVGFCEAELAGEARRDLERYITAGYHGDMGWLAARSRERASPRALWPEARSVVVLGLSYAPGADPLHALEARETGAISVYAHGRDYHDLVKSRLKRLAGFIAARWPGALKLFVDTAPVMEKPLAERAGIGWQGKHTNLVSRRDGLVALSRRDLSRALPPARCAARGSLRLVPAMSRCLPDQRIPGTAPPGCAALHLVPDDRAQGPHCARVSPAHRQPHLRLRRLPCRLPMEQVRASGIAAGARAARGIAHAAPRRIGGAR